MRERRWLLLVLYGLLLASAVSGALKATRPKFKIATTSTTTSTTAEPDVVENEDGEAEGTTTSSDVNATTARVLTGIPQIDYIWDPNLPRELNGYNLSEYPFYSSIPEEINFKCDGLHDGFYASVPHKCQVYHHCLYGTRYDFLCANFTAFDQRTFICHFASEVDCANSKKYWHRNDALYKAAETTTLSTTTTSTSTTPSTTTTQGSLPGPRPGGRRRRPYRRRPAYDYYEEYYDDEAYERTRPRGYDRRDEYEYEERKYTRRDRDRDRNYRERDYREREAPRSREPDRPLREPERTIKEEPPLSPRERFPSRNNRRDPVRPAAILPRDPLVEDEPRNRNRDQDAPIRGREPDDGPSFEDRRPLDSRNREVDDRRYNDKGYADDYEEEPVPSGPAASSGTAEVLVKPAAPPSSVYARPRAPPKIRRPVPITEQEKFAYKATTPPPPPALEPRRRPLDIPPPEDDYYEDELEEVRPRRPASRRRPGFRDFYENPRDRDRDRPFRMRYREEEEEEAAEEPEVRPRKHPERNRERYYERGPERGRDRSLDRSKDRGSERMPELTRERTSGRAQESDRSNIGRPLDREHEIERPRLPSRSKEPVAEVLETTRRPSFYERTSFAPSTTSTTSTEEAAFKGDDSAKPPSDNRDNYHQGNQNTGGRNAQEEGNRDYERGKERYESPRSENPPRDQISSAKETNKPRNEAEEYGSLEEDYEEPEYHRAPPSPPRTAVRVVKRPFLPSRGGNPNPRGLSLVGSKAPESSREEEAPLNKPAQSHADGYRSVERHENGAKSHEPNERQSYDAYKAIQREGAQKTRSEDYEQVLTRPATRTRPLDDSRREEDKIPAPVPAERNRDQSQSPKSRDKENPSIDSRDTNPRNLSGPQGRYSETEGNSSPREEPIPTWTSQEYRPEHGEAHRGPESSQPVSNAPPNRPKQRVTETSGYYGSSYARESSNDRDSQAVFQSGNLPSNGQTLNEVVTHDRLQDIPESEYDVTLNEALTPSFNNQETNLPSGFVLPIHRQLSREPILQSTENSFKVSRPFNQQASSSQSQSHQHKPFLPSPQFVPIGPIGTAPPGSNERSRSVQYFRTPEAVHVTGPQYRHQRGPWHDYTGY
ncbi:zinc finger CCCH domain-containing protein 18 [Venturia canescens]|uniref:zinc finger CCCH domain-containing protein 18 n=1 Tax=Venturia canescens TaxID=32260 RepID=UPI001C9D2DC7|nr:zinc finger CCCH domain-containing protein 18 [Venturia canescens]XP_043279174.1 zinc finger CCCH domain-containing protein 18 [Venturia canescens]